MREYFIVANSFAAPFFSDTSEKFVEGDSPQDALERFAAAYQHPCGLYAAVAYADANARAKGADPLAKWLCNHEQAKVRLTADLPGYSYRGHDAGDFEINGVRHHVPDPRGGSVVAAVRPAAPRKEDERHE